MTQERDILYENGNFWVLRTPRAYEVYETDLTHSRRRAVISCTFPNAFDRAKETCDKRHAASQS